MMDQTQWNALNQMLSRPSKSGQAAGGKANVASGGRQAPGTVQTRVISASNAMGQQRGSRQQLNGSQQESAVSGGVVKSLLTGRQYAQSVLRPDIGRGQTRTVTKGPQKQQVSLLQPQWQQQHQVDTSAVGETQQIMLSGLPENIGPGETLYVVVDGVTYQIDSSNAEQLLAAAAGGSIATGAGGASVLPVGSRISLEDLANISAEQQTLSIDYQSGDMASVSASDVKLEMQAVANSGADSLAAIGVQQMDGQQYFDAQSGTVTGVSTGNGSEQMQIIILPAEGGEMKTGDFKVGGQDFILQSGQQLPPELQEMVARGLPIDFSNYEFVIQDEDGNVSQDGSGATYLSASQGLTGGADGSSVLVSLSGAAGGGGTSEDILGMLAEASSHQGHGGLMQQWSISGAGASSAVTVTEEDDGEFAYLLSSNDALNDPGAVGPSRQVQESGFLSSFADFLSGAKAETLSSVANSTVVRKAPQLPIAYIPETNRKPGSSHDEKTKSPMTIVLTESATGQQVVYVNESGTPVSGRGRGRGRGRPPSRYIVQRFPGTSGSPLKSEDSDKSINSTPSTKDQIRQSIIAKRKRKGSDSDSFEEDEENEGGYQIITSADMVEKDLVNTSKFAVQSDTVRPPPVYRGRGRPRGSSLSNRGMGRGGSTGSSTAGSLTTAELLANASQQLVVSAPSAEAASFHLNPTEPHNYQKGDFVMERKDGWKTEGFPIWRIETGKLLQKFDPVAIEGGIIHKSASVYSSWSGDIRTSFKAVLVDMITSTAGRKQESVKVQEKFLTKAADDSLDEDPLMSTFIVFMHTMLSAAIDPTFLATILQNEEDEYYMSSVRQIDTLLSAATQSILSQIVWNETFKLTADALPYYSLTSLPAASEATYQCQACEDGVTPAVRSVKFYGVLYDRDLLSATQEVEKISAQEFLIGKAAADILISYHALHHFKFLLFQKCQEETNYLRQARKLTETDAMSECLQNRIFLQHYFRELQSLLQQFIIVEHAVEPAIDPSGEGIEGQLVDPHAMVEQQDMVDPQAMVDQSEIDQSVVDPQVMDASGLVMSMEPSVTIEPIDIEPTSLVEPSELEDPVAMETSADDQMALEQNDAEAVDEMVMVPVDECQPTDA